MQDENDVVRTIAGVCVGLISIGMIIHLANLTIVRPGNIIVGIVGVFLLAISLLWISSATSG